VPITPGRTSEHALRCRAELLDLSALVNDHYGIDRCIKDRLEFQLARTRLRWVHRALRLVGYAAGHDSSGIGQNVNRK
jgi:hypothetical protein